MWDVTKITKTCPSNPYQLEGEVDYKKPLYVRYRYGVLSFMVGTAGESVEEMLYRRIVETEHPHNDFEKKIGDTYDGEITFEEMKSHVVGLLNFGNLMEGEVKYN